MGLSLGEIGWTVCLAGLPWAAFLMRQMDLWHAQAAWMQCWILVLWGWSLTQPRTGVPNRPMAAWLIWIGLWTWQLFVVSIERVHQYPLQALMPFLHSLCGVLMVLSLQEVLTDRAWPVLLRAIAWSGVVVLAYGLLQCANLDQFFNPISLVPDLPHPDLLVGTIGNPSHFAAQVAAWLPIWLYLGSWWLGAAGVACGLLVATKSAAGCLAALLAGLWCAWHWARRTFWLVSACAVVGALGAMLFHAPGADPHGRWAAWQTFWEYAKHAPITGNRPGFVMELSQTITDVTNPIRQWRQCHNGYLQVLVETGVIGLGIVCWLLGDLIYRVWTAPRTALLVCLSGMLLAFVVNNGFNFPDHLWAVSAYALFAYAGLISVTTPTEDTAF